MVHNDLYLSVYVTMLALQSKELSPFTYLSSIKEDVQNRFGIHLNVAYFDQELGDVITDIRAGDSFHLKIFGDDTSYYSYRKH